MLIQSDLQKKSCTSVLEKLSNTGGSNQPTDGDDGSESDSSTDSMQISIDVDKVKPMANGQGMNGLATAILLGIITAINFFVVSTCSLLTSPSFRVVGSDAVKSEHSKKDSVWMPYEVQHIMIVFPTVLVTFLCMFLQFCVIGSAMKKYSKNPKVVKAISSCAKILPALTLILTIILSVTPLFMAFFSNGFPIIKSSNNEPYTTLETVGLFAIILPNPIFMAILVWGHFRKHVCG